MLKILCANYWEGPSFMLIRRLKREGVESEHKNLMDDREFFLKHKVMSCPVLLVFEDDVEVDRIKGMDDIISNLKNV